MFIGASAENMVVIRTAWYVAYMFALLLSAPMHLSDLSKFHH
jgi:hypothetical protein